MKIDVNGSAHDLDAATLATLLEQLGFRGAVVATALNGQFVAATERAKACLRAGDRVEIVAPMQGG